MTGKWGSLHYIDLFASAGIEKLKESGELNWGSPMIAAQARKPFDRLHLCELRRNRHKALMERVGRIRDDSQILQGDANENVPAIANCIPKNSLSLAFLYPYGLHLDYTTLETLADIRADLIIFFPDRLDALRNWEHTYLDNPESNLDRCLGSGADWRLLILESPAERRAETLRNLYVRQIRERLGYNYFEYQRISYRNHPLYILIFCSRHERGAELWRNVSKTQPNGQRTIGFE